MKKWAYALIAIFTSLLADGAYNKDSIESAQVLASTPSEEVILYQNSLDSFVINTYYKQLFVKKDYFPQTPSCEKLLALNLDSVFATNLAQLNKNTPFELTYNAHTRAFIELYLFRRQDLTQRIMGMAEYYFPIFEEMLDKYDLPIELKYLAIVESALNINARSRAGAAGLWQFMYRTGKSYGLEINSYIDDRYELYASTDAACRFFRDLYNVYDNWELVIAAYNCGPGNVNKAIRRSGGKRNYWEIREWLPRETRGYIPAFIAVNFAMNFGRDFGLIPNYPDTVNFQTDTLKLNAPFKFEDLCGYFCADPEEINLLNPSYRRGVLPGDDKQYTVRLPIPLMNAYLEDIAGFEQYKTGPHVEQASEEALPITVVKPVRSSETHIVKNGEVLGKIAEEYGCTVNDLMNWNGLRSSVIRAGQHLAIYKKPQVRSSQVTAEKSRAINGGENTYHVVKPGDTLWDIANLYNGVTVSELKRLNKGLNHKNLKPGSKIIVATKG